MARTGSTRWPRTGRRSARSPRWPSARSSARRGCGANGTRPTPQRPHPQRPHPQRLTPSGLTPALPGLTPPTSPTAWLSLSSADAERLPQVLLGADAVGLGEPRRDLVVDLRGRVQPEGVEHVARAEDLDPPEARARELAGQHDVAVEPAATWLECGEAHPHLERDPRALREHRQRAHPTGGIEHRVEALPNLRRAPLEEPVEVAERPAGVGLVAVREGPPAGRARPHGRHHSQILPSGSTR